MSTRGRGGARGGRGGRAQPEIGPDGKEINPYIPRYISNAPWYVPKSDDYLEHQRSQQPEIKGEWYDRGNNKNNNKTGPIKFRKGACKNCGSMSHKEVDCLERPRKIKAKYSGMDMAADDALQDIQTTWDSKRDRWNGYKADDYKAVVDRFEQEEQEKLKKKEEAEQKEKEEKDHKDQKLLEEKAALDDNKQSESDTKEKDDFGLDDLAELSDSDSDMENNSKKENTRTLRVREDKARYLQDLSEDAPVFNPKSRTLRTEEEGVINERGQFIRKLTDKAEEHDRYRRLAEEAIERGEDIHMEKGPTASLLKFKKLDEERKANEEKLKASLLSKYGGEEYFDKNRPVEVKEAPKEAIQEDDNNNTNSQIPKLNETESEKDSDGPRKVAKSKYPEDIYPGNHMSVWGSYWKEFKWGYACCHSLIKQSYCTGEQGKAIHDRPKNAMFTGNKRKHDDAEEE